jgi:hypothetical protein
MEGLQMPEIRQRFHEELRALEGDVQRTGAQAQLLLDKALQALVSSELYGPDDWTQALGRHEPRHRSIARPTLKGEQRRVRPERSPAGQARLCGRAAGSEPRASPGRGDDLDVVTPCPDGGTS